VKARFLAVLLPVAVIAAALIAWDALVRFGHVASYLLPKPSVVVRQGYQSRALLLDNLQVTVEEILGGLAVAVTVGILLGGAIAFSTVVRRSVLPLLIAWKAVPTIAIAPLIIIWFGYSTTPKVMITALTCFFPVTISVADGLRSVEDGRTILFTTLKANRRQRLAKLYLPTALPQLFTGLKIAAPLAIIGATISEWTGADRGLGYLIFTDTSTLNTERVFAEVALLSVAGILLYGLILLLEWMALPWRTRTVRSSRRPRPLR